MKTAALYLLAFVRSLKAYPNDVGGWKDRLDWEIGYADATLGRAGREDGDGSAYGHGYYCGSIQKGCGDGH